MCVCVYVLRAADFSNDGLPSRVLIVFHIDTAMLAHRSFVAVAVAVPHRMHTDFCMHHRMHTYLCVYVLTCYLFARNGSAALS